MLTIITYIIIHTIILITNNRNKNNFKNNNNSNNNNNETPQDSRRRSNSDSQVPYNARELMICGKCGKMAKHRTNECEGIKFKYNSAHAAKVPFNNSDWDDTPQQKTNSKTSKKSKRDEASSDDDEFQDNRSKRPTANVTRAIDFDSHIYSNNAKMGSCKDLNHDLLDKFNGRRTAQVERAPPLVCRTGVHWVRGSITAGISWKPPRRHALYGTGGRLPRLNRGTLALSPNQILKKVLFLFGISNNKNENLDINHFSIDFNDFS